MAVLRIPSEHRAALASLARLSDESAAELVSALGQASPKLRTYRFAEKISGALKLTPAAESQSIVLALIEMAFVLATAEVELSLFISDVKESMAEGNALTDDEGARLGRRLSAVLPIPSVAVPAKARALLIDHAHYMCESRIFTDVRPVFGVDVNQSPSTTLVVHTLKVTYHRGRADTNDFFVVMDSNDLDELSHVIDRARAKEKSLHAVLASAGLEPLE